MNTDDISLRSNKIPFVNIIAKIATFEAQLKDGRDIRSSTAGARGLSWRSTIPHAPPLRSRTFFPIIIVNVSIDGGPSGRAGVFINIGSSLSKARSLLSILQWTKGD